MKKTRRILLIAFLLCLFVYCCKVDSIPSSIILYNGESINLGNFFGISLKIGNEDCNTVLTSSSINEENGESTTAQVKLFDTFTVKEVEVSVMEEATVIPIGQVSGLKLYTNGALVVGVSEIKGEDNEKYKPYENSGIEEGDMIIEIDEKQVSSTAELIQTVNHSEGREIAIKYVRDGEIMETQIEPAQTGSNEYKLGLWVRDATAGVGTVSFYEPSTGMFAALRTWNHGY